MQTAAQNMTTPLHFPITFSDHHGLNSKWSPSPLLGTSAVSATQQPGGGGVL